MPAKKASGVTKVKQKDTFLKAQDDDSTIQKIIARTTNRTASGRSSSFSGAGLKQTVKPLYIYNLEKGLTKRQLRERVETMMGRSLTKSEYKKLKATRVKSLDDRSHRNSQTDAFGREIRTVRVLEAWRITYS